MIWLLFSCLLGSHCDVLATSNSLFHTSLFATILMLITAIAKVRYLFLFHRVPQTFLSSPCNWTKICFLDWITERANAHGVVQKIRCGLQYLWKVQCDFLKGWCGARALCWAGDGWAEALRFVSYEGSNIRVTNIAGDIAHKEQGSTAPFLWVCATMSTADILNFNQLQLPPAAQGEATSSSPVPGLDATQRPRAEGALMGERTGEVMGWAWWEVST